MVSLLLVAAQSGTRSALRHMVESAGYTINEAEDSALAIQAVQQSVPDIIVLDATSLHASAALVARLRQMTPAPILALALSSAADGLLAAGVDDVVPPDVHAGLLKRRLRYLLDRLQRRTTGTLKAAEPEYMPFQAILDSIQDGVQGIIFAEDLRTRRYTFLNTALDHLFGYELGELDSLNQLRPPHISEEDFSRWLDETRMAAAREGVWRGDARLQRKDGQVIEVGLTITRLNRADGRMIGIVAVFRDLSAQKALDAQKKRFIALAAHELRTPITSLKTRLFLAHRQIDQVEKHLVILNQISEQLEHLVEDLLDLSRFDHGMVDLRPTVTDLGSFVRGIVTMHESLIVSKDIQVVDEIPATPLFVLIDPARMTQVVVNLLANAVHHTPSGGSITFSARQGADSSPEADYIVLEVRDTGVGIPPEHLPHVFEPFYRAGRSSRGMGLGLSISREIVELHSGQISVESESGQGTRFIIWLKRVDRAH